jgi:hypothetical protein
MISLLGAADTPEKDVAIRIRAALTQLWPDLEAHSEDRVWIASNAKIYGYDVQDFDVIVCASFSSRRLLQPLRPIRSSPDGIIVRRDIVVRNFVVAVEAKGHEPRGVRFEGASALVKYARDHKGGWHDASSQSLKQAHVLRHYFLDLFGAAPFITNLLSFDNLEEADLPRRPHNILEGNASGRQLMTVIAEASRLWRPEDATYAVVSCGKTELVNNIFRAPLFRLIEPSNLDRRKMDQIAKRQGLRQEWLQSLGQQQLTLRGRGGTGKTVALLQLAHKAFEELGARTLILTYNLALAADMRRLTALLGIQAGAEDGGVRIDSVMSFVGKLLYLFGAVSTEEQFLENYTSSCRYLANTLKTSEFGEAEIYELLQTSPERFAYDYIMVDEAQDWPSDEIVILRACYPVTHFVIADGVDQFVRGGRASWSLNIPVEHQRVFQLGACLRLKANLVHFANAVAASLNLDHWRLKANAEARGGRVVIFEGDLAAATGLNRLLLDETTGAGNELVDVLYCVPPSLARTLVHDESSRVAVWLASNGIEAWDGTRPDVRRDIPRSATQPRIVQYESCRGLEAWMVLCLGFDEFLEHRYQLSHVDARQRTDASRTADEAARDESARWAMIPITRPMDTLVLQISDTQSPIAVLLRAIQKQMPDVVEWISARH